MRQGRKRATLAGVVIALCAATPAVAAEEFRAGGSTLGDPLFPQIGNTGYDAIEYEIDLRYEPASNRLTAGTGTTMRATATQGLSRFSLDFQRDLTVSEVRVDGSPAAFEQKDSRRRFSTNPAVTEPAKLFVVPPAGIPKGRDFTVAVAYSGEPRPIVDADESIEGWVRACSKPGECDGSFTVNEPIGAQSWFPSNNYATDKATFSTRITAPRSHAALGTGELQSRTQNPDGTDTWIWVEDDPTATYLTSATVGLFDLEVRSMTEATTGAALAIYDAVDSAGSAERKGEVGRVARQAPSMLDFLSERLGPYPFDSIGSVADWVPAAGYALENQTKPHYGGDVGGPFISADEQVHEIAHQWMGNSVSARRWTDIWFNEGWATFFEVYFAGKASGAKPSPRQFFREVYASAAEEFALAPAVLDGDPANLFAHFAVYNRPGAMLEGYREIVGNKRFFALAFKTAQGPHAYGTIGEKAFVRDAKRASGLRGRQLRRLDAYFDQWLFGEEKPSLTPADFER